MSDSKKIKKSEVRCRKWCICQNNPADYGETHDVIVSKLNKIKSLTYWCLCDEIGNETGTYHTHIYIVRETAIGFNMLQKLFPHAFLKVARGSSVENRNYIKKEGKYAGTDKQDTQVPGTFEEYGEVPDDYHPGQRVDLTTLYSMISNGLSDGDILAFNAEFAKHIDKFEKIRQSVYEKRYQDEFRFIETYYVSGSTGTGKTRGILEKYGYRNVYRVTDYLHPFDSYSGEDVILFDEFRSSLKIQDMLLYLDGYPTKLPCRYINRQACFTKVYILSNIDIDEQYRKVQLESPETWHAFLRRINHVFTLTPFGYAEVNDWQQLRFEM